MNEPSDSPEVTPPTTPRSRFAGISLNSVKLTSDTANKKRLLSDIEYLNNEQYAYLEKHTQQKFYTFVQSYWAKKVLKHDLTAKTFKGEVITFNWSQIRVVDKRYKGGSHCICGKAIRYEYWLGTYGPIGSVHVCEHAGLDGQLVKDLVKGYTEQNDLRTEIVKVLVELKDKSETYDDWLKTFDLEGHLPAMGWLSEENKTLINDLINLRLPLPKSIRDIWNMALYRFNRASTTPVVPAPVATPLPVALTVDASQQQFVDEAAAFCETNRDWLTSNQRYQTATLVSILEVVRTAKATPAQIRYAGILLEKLKKALPPNVTPTNTLLSIQDVARRALSYIINHHPTESFARNLYTQSLTRDLTDRQIECIFGGKTNTVLKIEPLAKKLKVPLNSSDQLILTKFYTT